MKLSANREGSSIIEQAMSSHLRKQAASADPNYQQWLQEATPVMKQVADMTRAMLGGGFMKNRPDLKDDMLRFVGLLDPQMLADPNHRASLAFKADDFDKNIQQVYAQWEKAVSTVERQKTALQKYLSLWQQFKSMLKPTPKAAPAVPAPVAPPAVSTQAPGTPKPVGTPRPVGVK
jgi:hypothetical protein